LRFTRSQPDRAPGISCPLFPVGKDQLMNGVSVVMATYNGEKFIAKQLESIRAQTLSPCELIVSDDGSVDRTLEIVSRFAETCSFPVHIRRNPENLGYGQNFLSAALLAKGRYVAFSDQDDEWLPEKLQFCVEALEREDALLCAHTVTLVDRASNRIGHYAQNITRTETVAPLAMKPWEVFLGLTEVFRRDLLDLFPIDERGLDNHAMNTPLAHDRWIYSLAFSLGRTTLIAQPLALYRQHGENVYGGMKKSLLTRLHGKFNGSIGILQQHMLIARHRADLLGRLGRDSTSPYAAAASAASRYWSDVARSFEQRADVYSRRFLTERVARLLKLVKDDAYRSTQTGELDSRLIVKDILLGVLRLPLAPKSALSANPVPSTANADGR
jgi:glycosyltransferase involved in cell wall biosynthesis